MKFGLSFCVARLQQVLELEIAMEPLIMLRAMKLPYSGCFHQGKNLWLT